MTTPENAAMQRQESPEIAEKKAEAERLKSLIFGDTKLYLAFVDLIDKMRVDFKKRGDDLTRYDAYHILAGSTPLEPLSQFDTTEGLILKGVQALVSSTPEKHQ